MHVKRRIFLAFLNTVLGSHLHVDRAHSHHTKNDASVLWPELHGELRGLNARDFLAVASRAMEACLRNVTVVSDRFPKKLRIENKDWGPAIWLHAEPRETAWIITNVAGPYWIQLAYQVGHELGHVVCNSWDVDSRPGPPSQWLEEALAEAFSMRGLAILADSWEQDPPFPADHKYAASIRQYRANLVAECAKPAFPDGVPEDWQTWARSGWKPQGALMGSYDQKGPVTLGVLAEMESNVGTVDDLGTLNRWTDRTRIPVPDYLRLWSRSCQELGSSGRLPRALMRLFDL